MKLDFDCVEIKNHPTLEMGKRRMNVEKIIYISNDDAIKLKIGDTVRLMDLCNIEIMDIDISTKMKTIPKLLMPKTLEMTLSHNIQKIQWVSKSRLY